MKSFILSILLLVVQIPLKAEIYDCFTFFNEIELLKLRFEELYNVVDHFVIVEGKISFTGKNKPLFFAENAHDFDKYKDKIIHIVIEDFPNLTGDGEKDHWSREIYSRDCILQGLKNCKDDDIVFISDLDEIPSARAVIEIQNYLSNLTAQNRRRLKSDPWPNRFVCNLDMRLFMYEMNRENLLGWLGGSKAMPYWFLKKHTPWEMKIFHHHHSDLHKISNAGWHFNTMGGRKLALYKWLYTGPIYYDNGNGLQALANNDDLLKESYQGQVAYNTIPVPVDESFPKYVKENLEHFRSIGWLAE